MNNVNSGLTICKNRRTSMCQHERHSKCKVLVNDYPSFLIMGKNEVLKRHIGILLFFACTIEKEKFCLTIS